MTIYIFYQKNNMFKIQSLDLVSFMMEPNDIISYYFQ